MPSRYWANRAKISPVSCWPLWASSSQWTLVLIHIFIWKSIRVEYLFKRVFLCYCSLNIPYLLCSFQDDSSAVAKTQSEQKQGLVQTCLRTFIILSSFISQDEDKFRKNVIITKTAEDLGSYHLIWFLLFVVMWWDKFRSLSAATAPTTHSSEIYLRNEKNM